MAMMQHDVSMLSQLPAITAAAATAGAPAAPAALAVATSHQPHMQSKQRATNKFVTTYLTTCSQLYMLFEHGLNGSRSWQQHKAETEEQGMLLHHTDVDAYSKFKPIIEAAEFGMQHSGMTEAQALQALDSMQRQLAIQPHGSGAQRSVPDMACGFSAVWNLDKQVMALAQQVASGGEQQLPRSFKAKAMAHSGSNTMIRPDMTAAQGITVWDFIQSAAAHRLCPQRAKEQWFDGSLPSMQTYPRSSCPSPKKRGRGQG
jgi:hypothetical protein